MKNIFKLLLIICLMLITLTGCKNLSHENTFVMLGYWDKDGVGNHLNAGSDVGPLSTFCNEGLVQYVRSTDKVYYMLAESIEHNADGTSLIHIRKDAKWHNGDDFVAMDVIGYWRIINTDFTNYIKDLIEVDSKTVKVVWKSLAPSDEMKTLLIAQDKVGSIKYDVFKESIDEFFSYIENCEEAEDGYTGWAPFNKIITPDINVYLDNAFTDFQETKVDWYVGTGPYKIYRMSSTQMILEKNTEHWDAENILYDKIDIANCLSELNQVYSQLKTGQIYYNESMPPIDTLNSILASNENLVHYKVLDTGSFGIIFNLEKDIWTDRVREAFQYIFNREEITKVGNIWAEATYLPFTSLPTSVIEKWVHKDVYDKLTKYEYNTEKAKQLLLEEGWYIEDGKWMLDGEPVSLNLGYEGSSIISNVAEAVYSDLAAFGIEVVLNRADGLIWSENAREADSIYDFSVYYTDLNTRYSHPLGCYEFLDDTLAAFLHLDRYDNAHSRMEERGKITLEIETVAGNKTRAISLITYLPYMEEEKLKDTISDLCYGMSKTNYGVVFFQNVNGFFVDKSQVYGLPLPEYYTEDRNVTYVPTLENDPDNYYELADYMMGYSGVVPFIYKKYLPSHYAEMGGELYE